MKKRMGKLFALFIIGCISISGCRTADNQENTKQQTDNTRDDTNEDIRDSEFSNTDSGKEDGQVSPDDTEADAHQDSSSQNTDAASGSGAASGSVQPSPDAGGSASAAETDGEVRNFVGIITDATPYSISVQSSQGNIFHMTIPESGLQGNLNSITVGQIVTISYTGSLDESHASLVGISSSSLITGIYVEEYSFAIKIINAVRNMDKDALIDLTNIPVFLDAEGFRGAVKDVSTLRNMDSEKLFTEGLVERMGNYNLFDLEYTKSGFVMGNGSPSITFDVDDDGILGIIGINSKDTK